MSEIVYGWSASIQFYMAFGNRLKDLFSRDSVLYNVNFICGRQWRQRYSSISISFI